MKENLRMKEYRSVYKEGMVKDEIMGEMEKDEEMKEWNESKSLWGNWGKKKEMREGGEKCICKKWGEENFKRKDKVEIMMKVRGEKWIMESGKNLVEG